MTTKTKLLVRDLLIQRLGADHPLLRFDVDPETGCWIHRNRGQGGYGYHTSYKGRKGSAHRLLYEEAFGIILPRGRGNWHAVLDHLCDNGAGGCVNPEHLKLTTQRENTLRSTNGQPCADKARQTHCKKGHPLEGDNLRIVQRKNGHASRICLTCQDERQKRWMEANPGRARELQKRYEQTEKYKAKRRERQKRYREAS